MNADILTSVLVGLAILVGCLGIILPVLPGSILIAIAVLVWAIVIGGPMAWIIFAIVAVFVAAGMSASLVLTGRKLKAMKVPNKSVLLAGLLGIIGFFVIPVVGLPIGFIAGLYLAEYLRLKEAKEARDSSWESLKAIGIGTALEFLLALLAAITFGIGNLIHFLG
ncbi:DUF456 domain-containing protein [Brevibacterium aurantiacum]|uniref:DUF456 domain-containing protein n=1 Tax=Brevibacterium aurantiacum TaxID=273384 RepID=A0A2A3Z7Y5_BREAU|nr:DUF456 domain-containing protein [Brevibacterium aurantiacum]MDN5592988.1 DUF456 domain-containing protein [Brevibacterium sp.]AZL14084.1 DUF456 domain-containing protein [Brevibacterium aurantiacum]AZT94621.1 DUF456 domain-containing protein [Brevibacterium aurantiacum]AZT98406.1 DUF456 domain-containing protein [Brevibacterium aurantiacum]MDN5608543.1 DUF456 domain-containing protein [Brevibacterium sp.]